MAKLQKKKLVLIPIGVFLLFALAVLLVVVLTYYAAYNATIRPVYSAFSIVSNSCNSSGLYLGLKNNAGSAVYVENVTLFVNKMAQSSRYAHENVQSGEVLYVSSGLNCKYLNYNYSIGVQVAYVYNQKINETLNNPITSVINGDITSSSI